jgi:DNA invertase Pin-like site-specific DNA recombinase
LPQNPAFHLPKLPLETISPKSYRLDDLCEKKMLIGYARVSTQDQNPDLQLDALQAIGCDKVFVEKASGAQRERPELLAALAYLRPEDTLVVWKLDRLARSLKQLIETIEGMEARQIGFRSLTEAIDTTTSGGRLIFHIFASLAEFERSIIRDRTRSGLESARARGRLGGRPPALTPDDLQAAKALLSDPMITVEEVARRLGVAPSTFYRHLPGGRSAA